MLQGFGMSWIYVPQEDTFSPVVMLEKLSCRLQIAIRLVLFATPQKKLYLFDWKKIVGRDL